MKSKISRYFYINIILVGVLIPFQNCSSQFQPAALATNPNLSAASSIPNAPAAAVPAPATGIMKTVFIAAGDNERTVMSCDDGKTWINDRSADDSARGEIIGGHSPRTFYGIDSADGYFYINYGWGYNGSLKKSKDLVSWEVVRSGSWGGGIAAFSGQIFHMGSDWSTSNTYGNLWNKLLNVTDVANGLSYPAVYRVNNNIFIVGRGANMAASSSMGNQWTLLNNVLPSESQLRSFAEGNGVIVTVGKTYVNGNLSRGYVTRSTDNGKSWSSAALGNDWTTVVFDGNQFVAWTNAVDNARVYKSTDGLNWTNSFVKINGQNAGWFFAPAASYNKKTGTYLFVRSGSDYGGQEVYRSTDGENWIKSDPAIFKDGHRIQSISVHEIDAAYCIPKI